MTDDLSPEANNERREAIARALAGLDYDAKGFSLTDPDKSLWIEQSHCYYGNDARTIIDADPWTEKLRLAEGWINMAYAERDEMQDICKELQAELEQLRSNITTIIRQTLDSPTFIDPVANCKNLTRALQEIELALQSGQPRETLA